MTLQMTHPIARGGGADTFFKLALAAGILVGCLEAGYLVFSPLPFDPVGYMVGRDFVNTWLGGKLALTGDPAPYFGLDAYRKLLAEYFGPNYPLHIWSYPPHFLLFTWPLALMPYMTAYVVYCALGMVLYLWVVSDGERRPDHLMLLALAPAAVVNIWTGQNGFFVAALLLGGILQLDRRPVFSGVLFGLLSIKPQLGVLLPLVLALTGRWRTIAAAAATVVALFAATTLAFGSKVWTAYWYDAMPTQSNVVFGVFQHYMVHMPTAFMNARVAGIPTPFALCIQAVVSLFTLAAVIWTYWRARDPVLSTSLLLVAVFTVTPYAFNYDMVVLGWVTLQLMDRDDNDVWDCALMLAVWAMPFLTVLLGIASIPASCLPILALGGRLVWRMWTAERARRPTGAGLTAGATG